MSDYELQLKIKNAPMLNMMRVSGYNTAAALSRSSGVGQNVIGNILSLKIPLYNENHAGDLTIRPAIIKLANHLACTPEELFPESHWYDGLEKSLFTAQVTREGLAMLTHKSSQDPMAFLEYMESDAAMDLDEMLERGNLTSREKKVIKSRFDEGLTLSQCAAKYDVSPERIRQIVLKAQRKLRPYLGKYMDALNENT